MFYLLGRFCCCFTMHLICLLVVDEFGGAELVVLCCAGVNAKR